MAIRSSTGHRVYIAGLSHHNYDAAMEYGDLVVVVSGGVDLDNLAEIKQRIQLAMENAEATDYVLLSGAPIICILCVLHMISRFGHAHVLQWNGVLRCYIHHKLEELAT